jgi:hypothetical protein
MWVPKGQQIPSLPWKDFPFRKVLLYYDGPRLELLRTTAGQNVLLWWLDAEESTERWLYLPLSTSRLAQVLSGAITTRAALEQPEDGYLYIVDLNANTGEPQRTFQATADGLDASVLPAQNARLDVPISSELLQLPLNDRAHQLVTKLEPTDPNSRKVQARVVGQFLSTLQRLVDSIGQAITGQATMRGPISSELLAKTKLNTVAGYPGSLTLYLESEGQDDLFSYSVIRLAIESMFSLIEAGNDLAKLTENLNKLRGRVAKNYEDLLGIISVSTGSLWIGWHEHGVHLQREAKLTAQSASNIRDIIAAASSNIQELIKIRGTFMMGSLRTLRFEVVDEQSGERFSGLVDEVAEDKIKGVNLGSIYDVTLKPKLEISVTTGEERTTYTLTDIRSIPGDL